MLVLRQRVRGAASRLPPPFLLSKSDKVLRFT